MSGLGASTAARSLPLSFYSEVFMSQIKRLQTIDADTLQSTAYEPVSFVIDDLLPRGLHLLAGAPKIGKSWLALWLCLCAAQGKPLWTFATRPCEVLYLCLEDSFQRIQSRLFDLTEDAPPTLYFAVMSQQLHNGLVEQIEQFLKEHPKTRLIVIDTLQRIRTAGNDANPYASDYRDIGVLKALADKHRIAILLVHHLRKMNDDDPMNMISGTTGLSGATDSNFVLRKSKRRENTATLYCTGRDIPYRELALEFDGEDHVWKLLSDDCEQTEQPSQPASIAFVWSAAKPLSCQMRRAGHGPAPKFRAEAHTHSKLRAFLRKRFYPASGGAASKGDQSPLRNHQLSEGTREIISERSLIMKKDIKFSTRMASADRKKIKALAAKAHMSMSDYVTACCLGKRIVVIDEQKELLRQLKGIGSNINRLTVLANMGKVQVIGLEKAAGELSEVSAALRAVMEGR